MRGSAIDDGADAIVVSNHGGRQLDGVAPTLRVLPEVVAAVDGRTEVLLDGGIRRGSDVVKALCLGARAVLIGRAYAYGLGAAGGPGVARAIEILRTDIVRTLKLLGCPSTSALNGSYVDAPIMGLAADTEHCAQGPLQNLRPSRRESWAQGLRELYAAGRDESFGSAALAGFVDLTNREDWWIAEQSQAGISSRV